jgi:hypothetical protein
MNSNITFKKKYLKYKSKYLHLKNLIQKGGAPLFDDALIDEIITHTSVNIRENIKETEQVLTQLPDVQKARLNLDTLDDETHKLGEGQFGKVYDLSPNYVLKKISKNQGGRNKTEAILKEVRMGYYVEYLNRTLPLYSGNLAHFDDDSNFYIIMKKFSDLKDLESSKKPECSDIDVAISFISQLFLLTNNLKNLSIAHGDEKFDNLLFEDTKDIVEDFRFDFNHTTYNIVNCGFKLRLIDWGEISDDLISSYVPLWNEAWLDGIKKGINGTRKDNYVNKNAPYTDYLEKICKIIGLLELNKTGDELNVIIPEINSVKIEEMKYNILINDRDVGSNPNKILQKINETPIPNLYLTFKKLYDSKNDQFLSFDEKVDFKDINFSELPRFKWFNYQNTNPIKIEYCDLPVGVPRTLMFRELNTEKLQSIFRRVDSNGASHDDMTSCPYFSRFVSGASQFFYVDSSYNTTPEIDTNMYNTHIKPKIDRLFGNSIFITRIDIGYENFYCNLIKTKNSLILLFNKKSFADKENHGYQIMILPFEESLNDDLDLTPETVIKYNPLGNLIVSDKNNIKQVFKFIKSNIGSDKDSDRIVIFPLGFFHFHLNYNPSLDKFFGVCHVKFEISHELGQDHMHYNGYLKKKVMYNGKDKTSVDLTLGNKEENFLHHNYIFSVSADSKLKLYKLNCNPPSKTISGESFNILGEVKIGISDNFFNTLTFANINYYNDPSIASSKDYVLIAKITPEARNINKAGGNQTFFIQDVPFTCNPLIAPDGPVAPPEPYQKEISDLPTMGLAHRSDDYITLRNRGYNHELAINWLFDHPELP